MKNMATGFRCASVTYRPPMKDWLVVLTHSKAAPVNLFCTHSQARAFQVGRIYDFLIHPENFRPQRAVPQVPAQHINGSAPA